MSRMWLVTGAFLALRSGVEALRGHHGTGKKQRHHRQAQ